MFFTLDLKSGKNTQEVRNQQELDLEAELTAIRLEAELVCATEEDVFEFVKAKVKKQRKASLTKFFKQQFAKPVHSARTPGTADQQQQIHSTPATPIASGAVRVQKELYFSPISVINDPAMEAKINNLTEQMAQMLAQLQTLQAGVEESKTIAKQAQEKAERNNQQPAEVVVTAGDVGGDGTGDAADRPQIVFKPNIQVTVSEKQLMGRKTETAAAKIYAYKSGNFKSWLTLFEAHADVQEWTDDRRLKEMYVRCQGPAEHVIRVKPMAEWTYRDLKEALLDRLCKPLNGPQISDEFRKLTCAASDDPDVIMTKVEEVSHRADETVPMDSLKIWMKGAFMDLIHSRTRMFYYVERKLAGSNDPYEALKLSKEYARKHGYEAENKPEVKQEEQKSDTKVEAASSTTTEGKMKVEEVNARFLPLDSKLSERDLIYRLNEYERFMRDTRDKLGDDKERSGRREQSGDRRSRRDYSSDRGRRRDFSSDRRSRRESDRSYDRSRRSDRESRSEGRYDRKEGKSERRYKSYELKNSSRDRSERKRSKDSRKDDREDAKRVKFDDKFEVRVYKLKSASSTDADTSVEASPPAEKKKE